MHFQVDLRVSQIIAGKRDTVLRFGYWFGTAPEFWLNLQAQYDLVRADKGTGGAIRHLPTKSSLPPQNDQPRLV